MIVRINLSALKQGRWYEHAVRFVLGGATTVLTGLIAKAFGPVIGGLFLALPAMLCASATMVEAHERRRKHEQGLRGDKRGKEAAALDAAGAALGALGMMCFAAIVAALAVVPASIALGAGVAGWSAASVLSWWLWKRRYRFMGFRQTK